MIVNQKEKLYTIQETSEILEISTQRLFEVLVSPQVRTVTFANRLYVPKDTLKKLTFRGDI